MELAGALPELGVQSVGGVEDGFVDAGEALVDVAGLQQSQLLVFEAFLLSGQIAAVGYGFGVDAVEDVLDHSGEGVGGFGGELDGAVVLGDQVLHGGTGTPTLSFL